MRIHGSGLGFYNFSIWLFIFKCFDGFNMDRRRYEACKVVPVVGVGFFSSAD